MSLLIEYIQCYWIPFTLGVLSVFIVKGMVKWKKT
jgi:hypothetical protein